MTYRWNIPDQRYFLQDLREAFTQQVLSAAAGQANALAEEATQWMRQNASWNDVDVWVKSQRGGPKKRRGPNDREDYRFFPAGNARRHLVAEVTRFTKEEMKWRTALDRQAAMENTEALESENRARARAGKKPLQRLQKKWLKPGAPEDKRLFLTITLKHGDENVVPYAIWLEIAHQGRYSILDKATYMFADKFANSIKRLRNLKQFQGANLPTRGLSDISGVDRLAEFSPKGTRIGSFEVAGPKFNYTRRK